MGADARVSGQFYRAVVMSVLLYGCETWVITPSMYKVLEGFHNRVLWRISGYTAVSLPDGSWEYPPISLAQRATSTLPLEDYISRRCNRVADEVACQPIFDLCTSVEAPGGSSTHRQVLWWESPGVVGDV